MGGSSRVQVAVTAWPTAWSSCGAGDSLDGTNNDVWGSQYSTQWRSNPTVSLSHHQPRVRCQSVQSPIDSTNSVHVKWNWLWRSSYFGMFLSTSIQLSYCHIEGRETVKCPKSIVKLSASENILGLQSLGSIFLRADCEVEYFILILIHYHEYQVCCFITSKTEILNCWIPPKYKTFSLKWLATSFTKVP